ncbi:MAG TPA: L-serine ammonia-lyase, iron-sulfur-dependent, subunit alpha, partial [Chitinophagales bacterium]|nr:L-serine ammonia-lyase, iron-sulfur-dependent, subunit alpha [Chitinophagales bacterium]
KRQAANAVITLDEVIETMRRTGEDLSDKYKETAQGGLAKLHKWTSNMGS